MSTPSLPPYDQTISVASGDNSSLPPGDAPYLLVIEPGSSSIFRLLGQHEVIIGRSTDAGLQLQHSSVSRRHARLLYQDDNLAVQDLGSHNGVLVNGERIHAVRELSSGDVIAMGDVLAVVHGKGAITQPAYRPLADAAVVRQRLSEEVERVLRCQRPFSLLKLDLGQTLTAPDWVASALCPHLRSFDLLGRSSDTQLAVVLPELKEPELTALASELLTVLSTSFPRARAGYSCCPADGCDVDTLLLLARRAAATAAPGGVAGPDAIPICKRFGEHEILVVDPAMVRLYELIERLGPSSIPVLIVGETGSGKELAAAALHHASPRRGQRLLAINCAALPESLAESELFGHERGAFSGAVTSKPGLLESAPGGTVFLDEVGELSLPVQAKLLRALETRRLMRVGDVHERPFDIRLVAATHLDLEAQVRAGRFRQDLYFRLAAAVVNLPPLRHRLAGLPMLVRAFLLAARRRLGQPPLAISDQVMASLLSYPWPGNVRELKNDMEFLAATVSAGVVEPWHLPPKLGGPGLLSDAPGTPRQPASVPEVPLFRPLEEELRELERKRITEALAAAGGVQSSAAELLKMPRRTFFAKTKQYGLVTRPENDGSTAPRVGSSRLVSGA